MRWVVVSAVALLLLATVGRADAVHLRGAKIDNRIEEISAVEEHRFVEAAPTSDHEEAPDHPAVAAPAAAAPAAAAPAAVESPAAEADPVGGAAKLDLDMAEARLVSEALKFTLPPEINISYLPAINFMGLSLSLTNVRLLGLDKFSVKPTHIFGPEKSGQVEFNKLTLLADPYIAGGRLLNLPFVGEGAFNATVLRLRIHVKFRKLPFTTCCPTPNSIVFGISLQQLIVKFENLNPGSDTGELINSMISGNGNDMMAMLTLACNNDTLLHPLADKIAVAIISKSCKCPSNATNSEAVSRETKQICPSTNLKSCNEDNFVEGDDTVSDVKEVRGSENLGDVKELRRSENLGDVKEFRGSETLDESVNEMVRLLTTALAEPIAEILDKSFKL